ncbi:MAG: hypothetical protein DRQ37_00770 [Gammaproteobacteria bacterium]|nr:MAG: hypothetical protein DRQ37_00770 [Gammaproteobacteria bacterium]
MNLPVDESNPKLSRRRFSKLCVSAMAAAGSPGVLARVIEPPKSYPRVQLVDKDQAPVSPETLVTGEGYLFHYPHISTPCFLIDLGRRVEPGPELITESGERYRWQGGVGPNASIVAFSAICAHRLTHPVRSVSFINYRHEPVSFRNKNVARETRSQLIYCCSEKSVYDPTDGARVLGGPAPQPLAAVRLEEERDTGALFASGVYGGTLFHEYFQRFQHRLVLEYGTDDIRQIVSANTTLVSAAEYCRNRILC